MTKNGKFVNDQHNASVSTANFDEFMDDIDEEDETSRGGHDSDIIEETENTDINEDESCMSSPIANKPKATSFVLSLSQQQHEQLQSSSSNNALDSGGRIPVPWTSPAAAAVAKEEAKQQKKRQRRQSTGGSNNNNNNEEHHVVSKEAVVALHCAATAAQTFEMHFGSLKNPQRENTTPLYQAREIQTAAVPLRHVGFYTEFALTGIKLDSGRFGMPVNTANEESTNHDQTDDESTNNDDKPVDRQEAARQRFWERVLAKDEQEYYSVKYLQGGLMEATDHGGTAAADMIFETRILMNLTPQHPNICMVYGVNAGGIDTFLETTVKDGFFLITDKITELLPERIEAWRKKEKASSKSSSSSSSISSKKKSSKGGGGGVTLSERLDVALDISSAMQFLHDRQIVYHLRPDKIGFEAKNEGRVKLCNFSQARYNGMREHQTKAITQSDDAIHVLAYTAPEVLCKSTVTTAADVYGFGILLYEITALSHPYPEYPTRALHWEHVVQQHMRPVLNKKWSKELRTLMESCWDPYLRLEMHKIHESLEHLLLQMSETQEQDRMQKITTAAAATAANKAKPTTTSPASPTTKEQPPLVTDRFAPPAAQHQKMPRRNSTGGALPVPTSVSAPPPPPPVAMEEKEEERSVASSSKKDKKSPHSHREKSSRTLAVEKTRTSASSRSSRTFKVEEDNRPETPPKHREKSERDKSPSKRDKSNRAESPSKRRAERSSDKSSSKKEKESDYRPESPRRQKPTLARPGLVGRRVKSEKGGGLSDVLDKASPFENSDAKSVSTSVSNARRSKSKGSLSTLKDTPGGNDSFSGAASVSGGTVATSASSRRAKSPRRRLSTGHVPASSQRQMLYKHTDEDEEDEDDLNTAPLNPWSNQFQQQQEPPPSPSPSETSPGSTTDRFGLHTYAVKPPPAPVDNNDSSSGLFNKDDSQSNHNDHDDLQEQFSPSSGPKSPMQRIRSKLKFMGRGSSRAGGLPLGGDEDDDHSKRNHRHDENGMPHRIPEPATASSSMLDYVKKAGFSKAGRRASVA